MRNGSYCSHQMLGFFFFFCIAFTYILLQQSTWVFARLLLRVTGIPPPPWPCRHCACSKGVQALASVNRLETIWYINKIELRCLPSFWCYKNGYIVGELWKRNDQNEHLVWLEYLFCGTELSPLGGFQMCSLPPSWSAGLMVYCRSSLRVTR